VTPRAHTGRPRKYLVSTKWMEPFQAQVDSLYLVLGEFQHQKDEASVGKAWMLTCVEGVNRPSFKQATQEQRMYQQEGTAVRRKWRFLATIPPPPPNPATCLGPSQLEMQEPLQRRCRTFPGVLAFV